MARRDDAWPTAAAYLPAGGDLEALRAAAAGCAGCPLHEPATQTVFGRGTAAARLMLVGEQPGDAEDTRGVPFVGPAGQLLVQALDAAGVDRSSAYVTNAPSGRRIKNSLVKYKGERSTRGTHRAACPADVGRGPRPS